MSIAYDEYLEKRNKHFRQACNWIKRSAPDMLNGITEDEFTFMRDFHHDVDTIPCLYEPYDAHLFGKKQTAKTASEYRKAKVMRIHMNSYNWQYHVLITEDEGTILTEMSQMDILELICEWWSYSWENDDLWSIFAYYSKYSSKIKMHKKSSKELERLLNILEDRLNKVRGTK